jgi:hypothetical protein
MMKRGSVSVLVSVVGLAAAGAFAQAPATPPAPPVAPPPPKTDAPKAPEKQPESKPVEAKPDETKTPDQKPADDLPSLDDLLGTGGEKPADAPGAAEKNPELDKLLSGEQLGEAFEQAVGLMKNAAKRLNESRDVGLPTQRVQEDALRKLDQLISSLDKQAQQQQQQQQQPGEPQDQQNQPRQRRQQQQQQQSQQPAQGTDPQEHDGPELQEGALNPELDSARAAWGALPARIRQMLMQGSNDRFSSLYNRLTQEYYRRLAEESSAQP